MLKSAVFSNFILFKKRQRLYFEDGANFLIGQNGSGRSSVFELVRRCLSSEINLSSSNIYDKTRLAYVICKYEIGKGDGDIPGKLKKIVGFCPTHCYSSRFVYCNIDNGEETHYKIVLVTTEQRETTVYIETFKYDPNKTGPGDKVAISQIDLPAEKHDYLINGITESMDPEKHDDFSPLQWLQENGEARVLDTHCSMCEQVLKVLTKCVALVFGKRSIDPTQWIKGDEMTYENRYPYYKKLHSNAQILTTLLRSKSVDNELEKQYFTALTYPQDYEFKVDNSGDKSDTTFNCTVRNNRCQLQTSLNKTSDGIIEAKQISLLLANYAFQTVIFEDVEKSMHPQMINSLRDLVLRKVKRKTVILSSNHPSMLTRWTIPRTCLTRVNFIGERSESKIISCQFKSDDFANLLASEEMKTILFASYVLFVEGVSDKRVIRAIIEKLSNASLEERGDSVFSVGVDSEKMKRLLLGLHIVQIDGSKSLSKVRKLCDQLNIPHMCICDKDVFITVDKPTGKELIKKKIKEQYDLKFTASTPNEGDEFKEENSQHFITLLTQSNIHMWRSGNLEAVVSNVQPSPAKKKKTEEVKYHKYSVEKIDELADGMLNDKNIEIIDFIKFLEVTAEKFVQ